MVFFLPLENEIFLLGLTIQRSELQLGASLLMKFYCRSADKTFAELIKRSVVSTVLCILADTSAFVIAVILDSDYPFVVRNNVYDANLLCNVMSMMGSFADWRKRFAPWCFKGNFDQSNRFDSTMRTTIKTSQHSAKATSFDARQTL